jgi:hypothetical protein
MALAVDRRGHGEQVQCPRATAINTAMALVCRKYDAKAVKRLTTKYLNGVIACACATRPTPFTASIVKPP